MSAGMDFALYHAAQAADEAWTLELRRAFGPYAGDYRYTPRGKETERLAELARSVRVASARWHRHVAEIREEERVR